jgi:hypothetical protein
MSSTDQMKDVFWIRSETMRKISLRPYHLHQIANTKLSSSMKQITHPMTYNSFFGRLLRSFLVTADSSSPVIIKTKSSNHFIPVAQWLNSELEVNRSNSSQLNSLSDDFAGSSIVHSVGAWAGLVGAMLLGPRIGKYSDGKPQAMPGHNMAIATLGALVLWIGWYGFMQLKSS